MDFIDQPDSDIQYLTRLLVNFRDERDWQQFHNPKDLALALGIEAAELQEAFLWKQPGSEQPTKVREELADVLAYSLLLAHHYGWNVKELVEEKIKLNAAKYPADQFRGSARKYNESQD